MTNVIMKQFYFNVQYKIKSEQDLPAKSTYAGEVNHIFYCLSYASSISATASAIAASAMLAAASASAV